MATLIAGAVAVVLLYSLLQMFRAANPAIMARAVRIGGGVLALAVAAFTGLRGELAVAIPLGIFGAGLLGWSPLANSNFSAIGGMFGGAGANKAGQTSRLQSHFLDVTFDRGTGAMTGRIIAGPQAGHALEAFDLRQLIDLRASFDADSVALLEAYLDRRFPAWRQHAQGNATGRNDSGRAASDGKMSDQEAYQILGLEPGAAAEEIGRAHRGLMKKFHPDQGGTTYLASRINAAKDTLLRTHRS